MYVASTHEFFILTIALLDEQLQVNAPAMMKYTHTHAHTYTRTYTHTHMRTHTYAHTRMHAHNVRYQYLD